MNDEGITSNDLRPSKRDYLRWSIPSIVLAVVSMLLIGYSTLVVEPRIQQRYEQMRDQNFVTLEISLNDPPVRNSRRTVQDSLRHERLLVETSLCLRRLTLWNPENDSIRFQSAIISVCKAEYYMNLAYEILSTEPQSVQIGVMTGKSQAEMRKALDAMRKVLKMKGAFAARAKLWIARQQLDDNLDMPFADLAAIEQSVRSLVADSSVHAIAKRTLGEILVEKSLRVSVDLDAQDRLLLLMEADECFRAESPSILRDIAWAAEAKTAVDPVLGQEIAWKASQNFWESPESDSYLPETIAAAFDCLVMAGSIKEAQSFLIKRLQNGAPFDQLTLRKKLAAVCLRSVVSNVLFPKPTIASNDSRNGSLIAMAVQLYPESPELLTLLEKTAKTSDDHWLVGVRKEIGNGEDAGLKQLMSVIDDFSNSRTATALNSFGKLTQVSPAYGVVASKFALRRSEIQSSPIEPLIELLREINHSSPEIFVVWQDRATLHLKLKQFEEAIECLEYLKQKMPDNEEVIELIEAIDKTRSGPNSRDH
jgi:tetratricopeptide (TPR) repeat protein